MEACVAGMMAKLLQMGGGGCYAEGMVRTIRRLRYLLNYF
jgi:hypothetical protein